MKEVNSKIFTRKQIMAIDAYIGLLDTRQRILGRTNKVKLIRTALPDGHIKISVVVTNE